MGLFDHFKKKEIVPDFSKIDPGEKVAELVQKKELFPLYLMPLRFNGEESAGNRLFVPKVITELKDRYDNMVEELYLAGKVNGYSCTPEYKGNSSIPSRLILTATKDGGSVFSETIDVW